MKKMMNQDNAWDQKTEVGRVEYLMEKDFLKEIASEMKK